MPRRHVVAPGENLVKIAFDAGFGDGAAILKDGANSDFGGREHPAMLDPGEELTIPDITPKKLTVAAGKTHRFVVNRPEVKLKVTLKTFRGTDTATTEVSLQLDDKPAEQKSLAAGLLEADLDIATAAAKITVPPPDDKVPEIKLTLQLGHLVRSESEEGALARLRNLGYYRHVAGDAEERERKSAIEEFQTDQQITVSGQLDDATKAKIAEIHGC